MFKQVLDQMRERVRALHYVMTIHAEEEMDGDGLTIFDVEHVIVTGQIVERQEDAETGEWKYLVRGRSIEGDSAVVVSKLSLTGKLVIITVYVEQ
ncbi:MAG: DUF4258 domain-containing protein [Pyrinomonadaceae bacterium]